MMGGVRLELDGTITRYTSDDGPADAAPNPTPLAWMDRLPPDRQVVLLEALDATPQGRRFAKRMLAATEIDPKNAETVAGVQMLRAGGVLTQAEADVLLA
jgi:hypothetical protein